LRCFSNKYRKESSTKKSIIVKIKESSKKYDQWCELIFSSIFFSYFLYSKFDWVILKMFTVVGYEIVFHKIIEEKTGKKYRN
jgi:hypothetical protein